MSKVIMEHPDLGKDRRQTVTRKQFDLVWVNSGWVIVEDLAETPVAELKKKAAEKNIEGRSSMSKDELIEALTEED